MLENRRYNQGLEANGRQTEHDRSIFLEEEYRTQLALAHLGIKNNTSPSEVPKVGSLLMCPELIPELRIPYAVEVLGMPHSGKSTMIDRYLKELWTSNARNKVALVEEGAQVVNAEYKDLRESDPFAYSLLGGTATFIGYVSALRNVNSGMQIAVSDREQIDRRVFRRALFSRGDVDPKLMMDEEQFMFGLENTPMQIGGIIMLMIRPEESIKRGNPGPVTNMEFLTRLYEQYWRLHKEILHGNVPWRVYTCIDAENDMKRVYERFKYALDSTLNIHSTFLAALAGAFPEQFDRVKAESGKHPQEKAKRKGF